MFFQPTVSHVDDEQCYLAVDVRLWTGKNMLPFPGRVVDVYGIF